MVAAAVDGNATARHELQGLQFVRANAALLVVLAHTFGTMSLPEYFGGQFAAADTFGRGGVGVNIFFVLSGFIIVYVTLAEGSLRPHLDTTSFLIKRFVRIVPFLWIVVAAYAVVRLVGSNEFEPQAYLNALFLLPLGPVAPEVVWTLRHEALFYLIFALAFLARKGTSALLYIWCASPIVLWALASLGVPIPHSELFHFLFSDYNMLFGIGVLIGLACQKYGLLQRYQIHSAPIAWLLVMATTLVTFLLQGLAPFAVVALACAACVIAGLLVPLSRSRIARLWELLGNASYSIYLTHSIGLSIIATLWVRLLGPEGYWAAIIVGAVLSTALGVLAHLWVERPVIRMARSAVAALRGRAPARGSLLRKRGTVSPEAFD